MADQPDDKKTIPNFVHKPMRGEFAVHALCLSDMGSRKLHRILLVGDVTVGMEFEFQGKAYRVERAEAA